MRSDFDRRQAGEHLRRWIYFKIEFKGDGSEKDARKWWAGIITTRVEEQNKGTNGAKILLVQPVIGAPLAITSLTAYSPTSATFKSRSIPCWTAKTDFTVFSRVTIYLLCPSKAFLAVSFFFFLNKKWLEDGLTPHTAETVHHVPHSHLEPKLRVYL